MINSFFLRQSFPAHSTSLFANHSSRISWFIVWFHYSFQSTNSQFTLAICRCWLIPPIHFSKWIEWRIKQTTNGKSSKQTRKFNSECIMKKEIELAGQVWKDWLNIEAGFNEWRMDWLTKWMTWEGKRSLINFNFWIPIKSNFRQFEFDGMKWNSANKNKTNEERMKPIPAFISAIHSNKLEFIHFR